MPAASAFRFRRFVTNLLSCSFLVAAVSGVLLFFRPEGSLARWVGWSVFGLDKKHWEALHLAFVVVFLAATLVHIYYNWSPLVAYLRRATGSLLVPSRELLASLGVVAVLFACTLFEWQPVSGVVALRDAMKDGALLAAVKPPLPDADRVTLSELCTRAAFPEQQALANARAHNVNVPSLSATLGAVARANHQPPEAVYRMLIGDQFAKP